ncbi:MAG TPA: MBL fold metallo-hydrolase [Pirellulales bacterium]|jgi:glyoxylase-like metal-dependent hydrolase (beta-lactamase superfamily II)|nr:MBL fold metallo-hydrolase [Pirellulales bacterium]
MRELAPGLWQLRGFPPHAINVYLAGNVLIDAGARWSRGRIMKQLAGRSISMVALTHCHPDHQGAAHALCERFQVPLACHAADRPAMDGSGPMLPDSPMMQLSMRLFAGPPHRVDRLLGEGDEVAGFRVIHAPGHTPGHVIFFRESDRVAIAGDVLNGMNLLTTMPGLHEPPWFFSADPAENRRSIRRLADLRPALVCFGHGPPWRDLATLQEFVDRLEASAATVQPGLSSTT